MNKRILILIIVISFYLVVINTKIIRKHKHPGSQQSSPSDIEIEPLTKSQLNEDLDNINLDSIPKDDKTKNNNEQTIQTDNQKEKTQKQKIPPNYYREDDEFVYGVNNDNKNDIPLDLDEEIKKREINQIPNPNPNPNNMHSYNTNNNNNKKFDIPNVDPEKLRQTSEQRKREQYHYNPRPHQQRVINPDNLNHGRHPGSPPPGQQPHGGQTPDTSNQPSKWRKFLSLFYQIMMIFFVVSFAYNYFLGKNQNDKHALVWYNENKEYFEERYDYFGVEDDDKLKRPKNSSISLMRDCKLIKENPYYYKLTCANYRYIHYLTVVLEFHKRYDMTSILSSIFISPKDRLVFQVSFEPTQNVGWIFCVSKKKQSKSLKKSYEDLSYFCQVYEPSSFNNNMCLISESLEMFMELFNNKSLFHYYKSVENYLEAIYYSDMITAYVEGNNIFFSFNIDLTRPYQNRILLEITHFVNLFVDTLAQLKYSKEFKEKVKNSRIMFERTKMDASKRKEIEEKESRDFIEKWKLKKKMRTKKGAERRKLERELNKYQ
jgi:hypothetical protein